MITDAAGSRQKRQEPKNLPCFLYIQIKKHANVFIANLVAEDFTISPSTYLSNKLHLVIQISCN